MKKEIEKTIQGMLLALSFLLLTGCAASSGDKPPASGENESHDSLFLELPDDFTFSSGAGGWSTDIVIHDDGSFTGMYHDSDMGDTGEAYPYGTVYVCSFSGQFSEPEPTDKAYVYAMELLELTIEDEDKVGTEEIADEMRYVYTTPYGFDEAKEFLIYLPETPVSELTEECLSWTLISDEMFKYVPDSYYILYNVGGKEAFVGIKDGSIWSRSFVYAHEGAHASFSPSYYMGSYLTFFADEDAPADIYLSVPWDGKSTETMRCENDMFDDASVFDVTIEPAEDSTPEVLKYRITLTCVSDPAFDFSAWGGSADGTLSVVFTETAIE